MSTTLIYHRAAVKSAPRLASFMGIESSLGSPDFGGERPDHLIRYGSTARSPLRPSRRTINARSALSRYETRLDQLKLLKAGGVRVPRFSGRPMRGFKQIARLKVEGRQATRGEGLEVLNPHQDGIPVVGRRQNPYDCFVHYLSKERQFRVHYCLGSLRTRELIPDEEENKEQEVWNLENGFTYRIPEDGAEDIRELRPIAAQAAVALGLHFGAVDIIIFGGQPFVLEVNTAPGLSDPTLEWYAERLGGAIGLTLDDMPKWDAEGLERLTTQDEEIDE